MSELLQRFRERFQMWHEERLGGPSGAPAGGGRPLRNPLSWAVLGAIILLLPPYRFRDVFDLMLPTSALVFLGFYFARSRFAWHVLAAELLIVTPLYVFFSFSWRLQRAMHPWIFGCRSLAQFWSPDFFSGRGSGILRIWSSKSSVQPTNASNQTMERTATRCAFTLYITRTHSLRATLAVGGRRSSYSR
jgi:hypothetical protein